MAEVQPVHQAVDQIFELVRDDTPADLPGLQPGQQVGHAGKEPGVGGNAFLVAGEELGAQGRVVGVVGGGAQADVQQAPRAGRGKGAVLFERQRLEAAGLAHGVDGSGQVVGGVGKRPVEIEENGGGQGFELWHEVLQGGGNGRHRDCWLAATVKRGRCRTVQGQGLSHEMRGVPGRADPCGGIAGRLGRNQAGLRNEAM